MFAAKVAPIYFRGKRATSCKKCCLGVHNRRALRQQEPSLREPGAGRVSQGRTRAHGGGIMKQLGKWILGAAMAAGSLGLGSTAAHAAQIGVYVSGGPVAYVPPCPGPGYQ